MSYSFIGFQTAYIATAWNSIFWDTACLIVNSGSLEDNSMEEVVNIYEPEKQEIENGVTYIDLPDRSGKIKKTASSDYAKIAKALGDIINKGIKVSLIDINKSNYGFKPDKENNQIMFGLKALSNIGEQVIDSIIGGRPYVSFNDFLYRCPLNKSAMISLIKSGAFDKFENDWARDLGIHPRVLIMAYYLYKNSDLKTKLNLQNFNGLLQKDLIPKNFDLERRTYNFNKYLKSFKVGKYYTLNEKALDFYQCNFDNNKLEVINGVTCILQTAWDKQYSAKMDVIRDWLKLNQDEVLTTYNNHLFEESWLKYAEGNISFWEMQSLCFYYHEHELSNIDVDKYGIRDFNSLPYEPEVDYFFKRNGKEIPIYKTYKIIGTVISKNDTRSSVSILTTTGVVNVKFTKEYFAMFNRQISERQEDGTKKIMEKGWFQRGTKIMCTGFRREDTFVAKTYKHTLTHQIYKITSVFNDGKDMEIEHERYGTEED